uniref:Uncharacterized protein n=1 Tax=Electrophorus electricus TaxID=8005 RepID=A0AAY5EMB5_ELEEL
MHKCSTTLSKKNNIQIRDKSGSVFDLQSGEVSVGLFLNLKKHLSLTWRKCLHLSASHKDLNQNCSSNILYSFEVKPSLP